MNYYCKECGTAVIVLKDSEPIKACKCDAPIIVEMQAEATASAGLNI